MLLRVRHRSCGAEDLFELLVGSGSAGARELQCGGGEQHACRGLAAFGMRLCRHDAGMLSVKTVSYICLRIASGHQYGQHEVSNPQNTATRTIYKRAQSRSAEGAAPPLIAGTIH